MFGKNRFVVDTVAGAALGVALLLVFVIDRATRPAKDVGGANTLDVKVLQGEPSKKLRLAMTPTYKEKTKEHGIIFWDDMGRLLRELGKGYNYDEVYPKEFAHDPEELDKYDVLFLTCHPKAESIKNALIRFVERGGTLYASDWRFDDLADAFPQFVDGSAIGSGTGRQDVRADVVDPGLREYIGTAHVDLKFDLPQWKTAAFAGTGVTVMIRGKYKKQRDKRDQIGDWSEAPLLVRLNHGKGTIIFTSFHNEKQNSDVERKLLQYLVFTLVTAGVDAEVSKSIEEAGFAAQKSNLLTTSSKETSITRTFQNAVEGPLRISLGFRDVGAELRLLIKAPDGRFFNWKGTSTVILEVPNAMKGEWTYTITRSETFPDNIPFKVSFSHKK
jgi:hypothetical protein